MAMYEKELLEYLEHLLQLFYYVQRILSCLDRK
jgi:hypothetical protein